jgi:prepilin-type N-terminal cleavage/methylation domain-containing protein
MKARTNGFSLVELMIVVAIIVILTVIAIPSIHRLNSTYKIDASGHSVASLLAQARLQAVHNNAPAYTQFNAGADPTLAFVNNDGSSSFAAGDSDVATSGGVKLIQDPGGLNHQQLDAYLGVTAGGGGPSLKIGLPIGFNARGLPCVQNGPPAVCLQDDGTGAVPVFEWFMTDSDGNWEAVTVTAAGRIKAWRYTGQGTWQ